MRENPETLYKTLIPCNLYGRYDNLDPENSHLIPAIIHKVHQAKKMGRPNVEIWGDGNARREFMYAGDFVDAVIKALYNFDEIPDIMNIGLGIDYTILEYYQTVADILGYKGSFIHNLSRPVGMNRKLLSVRIQNKWGWSAQHTLREGIMKTYKYYLQEQ